MNKLLIFVVGFNPLNGTFRMLYIRDFEGKFRWQTAKILQKIFMIIGAQRTRFETSQVGGGVVVGQNKYHFQIF